MEPPTRTTITPDELRETFGFGVAGNFAGHLEQAGEAADFVRVDAAPSMPKGIFPWYVPGHDTFLGVYPTSSDHLRIPESTGDAPLRIQVEPEASVLFDVTRDEAGEVVALAPRWIAAFDDCSLRRPGANKISEKKNWGAGSTGLATTAFQLSDLDPAGTIASLRLACFLRRGEETHAYGVDSAVPTYTLIGDELVAWLVDRLREQRGSSDTPLEDVGALLRQSGATTVLVGIGATRYEPYGETTFVESGDDAVVVLYDASAHDPSEVASAVHERRDDELRGASLLRRTAVSGEG